MIFDQGFLQRPKTGSSTKISSPLKTDDTTRPMAAASRPQKVGEDLPPTPRTLQTRNRVPTFPHMNSRSGRTEGNVVECVGHVHDEPLLRRCLLSSIAFSQPWQYNPLRQGHSGVDVRPKKVLDELVLQTSIQCELGNETKLEQHKTAKAQVALEFVKGVEEQAVARALLGM